MAEKFASVREGVRNSAVIKNPVLFEAIGIAPVVAMAVSVKTAVMLSVISTVELVIIESFACLLLKKVKQSFRVLIYAVLGVLINIPLFMFFSRYAPNETANVSIFIPIIAVNSLIALHCERVAVKNNFKTTLVDAISASVGYVFIVFLLGIIRELLGSGTFYSFDLKLPVKFSALVLPFGGFLLLGFTAAFFKRLIKKKYPDEKPEAAFNLSEISDMNFAELKTALEEDFNPFDDFFRAEDNQKTVAEETEKPEKKKKLFHGSEKKLKPEKEEIIKETEETPVVTAAEPVEQEQPESRVRQDYISEFDDLLAELEAAKAVKKQADAEPEEQEAPSVEEQTEPSEASEGGEEE